MKNGNARILTVDDEVRYLRLLQICLEAAGYEVIPARDGRSALEQAAKQEPDLILLDLMLPDISGVELCRQIREFSNVPVIMLTARAEEADKIQGLDTGADDYITKPFSADELLARVRAALRRAAGQEAGLRPARFQVGGLEVDFVRQEVRVEGQEVHLTATEYRLLVEMIHQPNRVLVPEYLLEKVWGPEYGAETRLLWQAVHRLRQKIEVDPKHPRFIRTKPGAGYIFTVREGQ
jgi:DNA-binding response OmpR family regulator